MLNNPKREALRRVRFLIATRQEVFICHALDTVADRSKVLRHACEQLRSYVGESLKPSRVLQNWQEAQKLGDRGAEQRRADRLAWIDWMLNEPDADPLGPLGHGTCA